MVKGIINSYESCGTLDGPGIRFVVFLQGCKLRCLYCHNPETWDLKTKPIEITPEELIEKVLRYKSYFGKKGGITFSGGEPLLQPEFVIECLKLCKKHNINTCLDTAGVGFGDYDEILKLTDLVILDVKAVNSNEYKKLTGRKIDEFNKFLDACQKNNSKLWIRQVIVPGLNDDREHIEELKDFIKPLKNVKKCELLAYHTMGVKKYATLGLRYRLDGVKDLSKSKLNELTKYLKEQ